LGNSSHLDIGAAQRLHCRSLTLRPFTPPSRGDPMTAIAEEPTAEITRADQRRTVIAVSGVVDLSDGRGFLRTAGYRRSSEDIPITSAQVRQYWLRTGDHIEGTTGARQGKTQQGKTQQGNSRQDKSRPDKALLTVEFINGRPAHEARHRPNFDDLTPIYPNQ